MPSRTSSHPASDQSASGSKWHATVPVPDPIQESEASWDDTENAEPDEPLNLDDPWAYTFEVGFFLSSLRHCDVVATCLLCPSHLNMLLTINLL
jgi:hypothetical protein